MKRKLIIILIILGCLFVLALAYFLITKALLKTDSFRRKIVEDRLQLKLPEHTEFTFFDYYGDDTVFLLLFKRPIAIRAVAKISTNDEENLKEQLSPPLWKAGYDNYLCNFSYWEGYDLGDALALYYRLLPVYIHKSQGDVRIALFPGSNDKELAVCLNFFG